VIDVYGRFGCIIADPPWRFRDKLRRALHGGVYAATMADAQVLALPVAELAAATAHLYLWTTDAHLELALACVRRWGFRYVHPWVWVKTAARGQLKLGGGHYGRHAHELCLFAVRDRTRIRTHDIPTVFAAPLLEHSRKPDRIHEIAEKLSPAPRIELFARRRRRGWQAWGNEIAA